MSESEQLVPNTGYEPDTFAYLTFTERLPIIITRLIDNLYSQVASNTSLDYSTTIRELAKLKHDLTRNCCKIYKVKDTFEDASEYNSFIDQLVSYCPNDATPTYRNSPWIATECIFYRKIFEVFSQTTNPINMEYFLPQKEHQFDSDKPYICLMVNSTLELIKTANSKTKLENIDVLPMLFQYCLWANRMDLSLSGGAVVKKEENLVPNFSILNSDLEKYLLCDDSCCVTDYLKNNETGIFDIVLDNYASEFATDLCLVAYLLHTEIATKVRLHCKRIPWFVSDVQKPDVSRMLENLRNLGLTEFTDMVREYFNQGMVTVDDSIFWTGPYIYSEMKNVCSSLYEQLSESSLIIFKGDLNYRKLVGDYVWPIDTDFKRSLCGFLPAPILAIRTLKATTVSGLNLERFKKLNPPKDWMTTGTYGVMQFTK